MRRINILALATGAAFLAGFPAFAAEPDLTVEQNCRTALPQDQGKGPASEKVDGDSKLSDTLANCKGVLRPPAVGDEMAVPPPKTGAKTPVLPPGSVPQQTPKG
jgi:hypothetical protein